MLVKVKPEEVHGLFMSSKSAKTATGFGSIRPMCLEFRHDDILQCYNTSKVQEVLKVVCTFVSFVALVSGYLPV